MNKNNGIIEYKESFITKIRKLLKKLFGRKKEFHNNIEDTIVEKDTDSNNIRQENFFENIKVDSTDIDKVIAKKNFFEEIDGNIEDLKLLSVDRLIKLKEHYDGIIEKNEEKIKKLKANA